MTRHELHHEKLTLAMREVIHDSGQRRMSQVRQQLSLTLECAPLFVGDCESLFDRDDTAEVFVHRLIDCAHAAVAKLMNDAIAFAENGVWCRHRHQGRSYFSGFVPWASDRGRIVVMSVVEPGPPFNIESLTMLYSSLRNGND